MNRIELIVTRLNCAVENLINQGVTTFISGGEPGFDLMAASLIVAKKEMKKGIRLLFVLPYKGHGEFWNEQQKELYHNLLAAADEAIYLSEEYYSGCLEERNRYMADRSAYCICTLMPSFNGTEQKKNYDREKKLKVINLLSR